MQSARPRNFNLPYQQYDNYWVILFAKKGAFPASLANALQGIGYRNTAEGVSLAQTEQNWSVLWKKTYEILQNAQFIDAVEVTLTADDSLIDGRGERKSVARVQEIAGSLWLGDALRDGRVMCYFQPIVSGAGSKEASKNFGFESFVRAKAIDGKIISGGSVVQASKAMNIEYMVDRLLHIQAIKTFAASNNTGFLFINFFTGFIQRPEVYLEGLRETAKAFGIVPKNLVLEFASGEPARDIKHLKNVCEYAKMQGYSVALDDVTDPIYAQNLIDGIRPDFVKLDVQELGDLGEASVRGNIRQILELAEANGGSIIAEGVETEESYEQLKALGVSLFQGYLFSAPAPLSAA